MSGDVKRGKKGVFWVLVRHEFVKICRRPTAITAIVAMFLAILGFSAAFTASTSWSQLVPGSQDTVYLSGSEAIRAKREDLTPLKGLITEESIEEILKSTQEAYKNPDYLTPDGGVNNFAWASFIQPYEDVTMWVSKAFAEPGVSGSFSDYLEVPPGEAYDFYEKRQEKIAENLQYGMADVNCTEGEKAFILEKSKAVDEPIRYGYSDGWRNLLDVMPTLGAALCFAVCVCIAPCYAAERQVRTCPVLLAARYGRTKLNGAKLLACTIFSTAVFAVMMGFSTGIFLSIFSADGWEASWQSVNILSHQPYSVLQIYLFTVLLTYLWCMLSTAVTLLLSSVMPSAFPVIAVSAVLIFSPMFVSVSNISRLWNHLIAFLPAKIMDADYTFGAMAYTFFGRVFSQPLVVGTAVVLMTWLFLFVAYRKFKSAEIS